VVRAFESDRRKLVVFDRAVLTAGDFVALNLIFVLDTPPVSASMNWRFTRLPVLRLSVLNRMRSDVVAAGYSATGHQTSESFEVSLSIGTRGQAKCALDDPLLHCP
jgi:hypothetical protein